jgi:hypothetical protein
MTLRQSIAIALVGILTPPAWMVAAGAQQASRFDRWEDRPSNHLVVIFDKNDALRQDVGDRLSLSLGPIDPERMVDTAIFADQDDDMLNRGCRVMRCHDGSVRSPITSCNDATAARLVVNRHHIAAPSCIDSYMYDEAIRKS